MLADRSRSLAETWLWDTHKLEANTVRTVLIHAIVHDIATGRTQVVPGRLLHTGLPIRLATGELLRLVVKKRSKS